MLLRLKGLIELTKSPLARLSMFHDKTGAVWLTLNRITEEMKKENIDYAIIGGLAVYHHGYERSTNDCDFLLTKSVEDID